MKTKSIILFFVIFSLLLSPASFAETEPESIAIGSGKAVDLGSFSKVVPIERNGVYAKADKTPLMATLTGEANGYEVVVSTGGAGSATVGNYFASALSDEPQTAQPDAIIPYPYPTPENEAYLDNCTLEEGSTFEGGVCIDTNKTNSTNVNCAVLNSTETDSNCGNSTLDNCTLDGSVIIDGECNDSIKVNSTNDNCDLLDSSEINSACDNSTLDNCTLDGSVIIDGECNDSIKFMSTNDNCDILNSFEDRSNCTNSTLDNCTLSEADIVDSECIDSNKTLSTNDNCSLVDSQELSTECENSTLDNCTIWESTMINGECIDSWKLSSNNTNCSIMSSEEWFSDCNNSILDNCTLNQSVIIDGVCNSSIKIDSTNDNCDILDSYESNVTCGNSSLDTCYLNQSTIVDSDCLNSTKVSSNNENCSLVDSYEEYTQCGNSTLDNCTVNASIVDNVICNNSVIEDSIITCGDTLIVTNALIRNGILLEGTVNISGIEYGPIADISEICEIDDEPPEIIIFDPANNSVSVPTTILLRGQVIEENFLDANLTVLDEAGNPIMPTVSLPQVFNLQVQIAQEQQSAIRVCASDESGNSACETVYVTHDFTGADLYISSPLTGTVTNQSQSNVGIQVAGGITDVSLCNGADCISIQGSSTYLMDLHPGDNRIQAYGFDTLDRYIESNEVIIIMDNVPPMIDLWQPSAFATAIPVQNLTGMITDQHTYVREASYSLTSATIDEGGPLTAPEFSESITLAPNEINTLRITAVDHEAVNNTANLVVQIDHQDSYPWLEILAPDDMTYTTDPTINVRTNVLNADAAELRNNGAVIVNSVNLDAPDTYDITLNEGENVLEVCGHNTLHPIPICSNIVRVYYETANTAPTVTIRLPDTDVTAIQNQILRGDASSDAVSGLYRVNMGQNMLALDSQNNFEHGITLEEGANQIAVRVRDAADLTGIDSHTIEYDPNAPWLEILQPSYDTTTDNPQLNVVVNVSNADKADLTVNGQPVTSVDEDAVSEHTITLVEGLNVLRVCGTNADYPSGICSNSVYVTLVSQPQAPIVQIDNPTDGQLLIDTVVNLMGTVNQEVVAVLTVQNGTDMYSMGLDVLNNNFDEIISIFANSQSTITVTATNAFNLIGEDSVTVTHDPDGAYCEWVSPQADVATNQQSYPIEFRCYNINYAAVLVDGFGQYSTTQSGTHTLSLDLTEGDNLVKIAYDDGTNNYETNTININLDTKAPEIRIIEPSMPVTPLTAIDILAEITDENLAATTFEVWGGQPPGTSGFLQSVGNDRYSAQGINLIQGAVNTVNVTATDSVGNVAFAVVQVRQDSNAPLLIIRSPEDGYVSPQDNIETEVEISNLGTGTADLLVNGAVQQLDISTGTYTVNLEKGLNRLVIRALKDGEAYFSNTVQVTYDNEDPLVNILSPSAAVTPLREHTLIVDIMDESDVTATYEIEDESGAIVDQGTLTLSGEFYTAQITIAEDQQSKIRVRAVDEIGLVGTGGKLITHDPNAPLLEITWPEYGHEIPATLIDVMMNIQGVDTADLYVNGEVQEQNVGSGQTVTLQQGNNYVWIRGYVGNDIYESNRVLIISDIEGPEITIDTPGVDVTPLIYHTLSGTIVDDTAIVQAEYTVFNANDIPIGSGSLAVAQDSTYSAQIALAPDQKNTISVTAVDKMGWSTSVTKEIWHDSNAPLLEILSPANGYETQQAATDVTVRVLNADSAELWLNDAVDQTGIVVNGVETYIITLEQGKNVVYLRGHKDVNTYYSEKRLYYYDTEAPIVTIERPSMSVTPVREHELVVNIDDTSSSIIATYEVQDASGTVIQLGFLDHVNGKYVANIILAEEQLNTIVVRAEDSLGQIGSAQKEITHSTSAPLLEIISPADGYQTTSELVDVEVRVRNADYAALLVNGIVTDAPVSDGIYTVDLRQGSNLVWLWGMQGSTAYESNKVEIISDGDGPEIILNSFNFTETNEIHHILSGEVVDSTKIESIRFEVRDSTGQVYQSGPIMLESPTFHTPITLAAEQQNTIFIEAIDELGNVATLSFTVTHSSVVPTLEILSPATGYETTDEIIEVVMNINATSAQLLLDGVIIADLDNELGLTLDVALSPGWHTLYILGDGGTYTSNIVHVLKDDYDPIVTIVQPSADVTPIMTHELVVAVQDESEQITTTCSVVDESGNAKSCNLIETGPGEYSTFITLAADQMNTIIVTATDGQGRTDSDSHDILHESTAPILQILYPEDQQILTIGITDVDVFTYNAVAPELLLDGFFAGIVLDSGFSTIPEVALHLGANELQIHELGQDVYSDTVTLIVDPSAPNITITQPSVSETYFMDQILAGTITDDTPITSAYYILEGATAGLVSTGNLSLGPNGEFSVPVLLAEDQLNTLRVFATDSAGNTASASVQITHNPDIPGLRIVSPPLDTVTNDLQYQLTLEVANAAYAMLTVNGDDLEPVDLDTISTKTVDLSPGDNVFQIYGNNSIVSGMYYSNTVNIVMDNTCPIIVISQPAYDMVTPFNPITLAGNVTDAYSQISAATYEVRAQDQSIVDDGTLTLDAVGGFSESVLLAENQQNTITVTAYDDPAVNNRCSESVLVTHDEDAAFIEFLAPPDNFVTDLSTVDVTINISNAQTARLMNNGVFLMNLIPEGVNTYPVELMQGLNNLQVEALSMQNVQTFSNILHIIRGVLIGEVGEFTADKTLVKNGDVIEFTFNAGQEVTSVTVDTSQLSDSVDTLDLVYQGDGIYSNNLTVDTIKPDGERNIILTSDSSGVVGQKYLLVTLDNTPPSAQIMINSNETQTDTNLVILQMVQFDDNGVKECRISNTPFLQEQSGQSFQFDETFANEDSIDLDNSNSNIDNRVGIEQQRFKWEMAMIIGVGTDIIPEVSRHDYTYFNLTDETIVFRFNDTEGEKAAEFCIEAKSNESDPVEFLIHSDTGFIHKANITMSDEFAVYCFDVNGTELNYSTAYNTTSTRIRARNTNSNATTLINHAYMLNLSNGTMYEAAGDVTSKVVVSPLLDIYSATLNVDYEIPMDDMLYEYSDRSLVLGNSPFNTTVSQDFTQEAYLDSASINLTSTDLVNATVYIGDQEVWSADNLTGSVILTDLGSYLRAATENCTDPTCYVYWHFHADHGTLSLSNWTIEYQMPAGEIKWFMAADGVNFEEVEVGVPHNFTNEGRSLKWRAELFTNNFTKTPVINSVTVGSDATPWEPCVNSKAWELLDQPENVYEATVYYQVKDNVGWITSVNDSIIVNKSAVVRDWTPPTNLTILSDAWTNDHDFLELKWYAFDRESKVFYKYRIYEDSMNPVNQIYPKVDGEWQEASDFGQSEYEKLNMSEIFDTTEYLYTSKTGDLDNHAGDGHEDEYYIEVVAFNSYFIESEPVVFKITLDYEGPGDDGVSYANANGQVLNSDRLTFASSIHHYDTWTNSSTLDMYWSSFIGDLDDPEDIDYYDYDDVSGVGGYSYILTTDVNATPDAVPEGDPDNLLEELNVTYNDLADGTYYFKMRAVDRAGNAGQILTWIVKVDTNPPGPPQLEGIGAQPTNDTLFIDWIDAKDGSGSGIKNYTVMLYNNSAMEPDDLVLNISTGDNSSQIFIDDLGQNVYYIRIYAYDWVGFESLPSDVLEGIVDTTPPEVNWIKPDGVIVTRQPTFAIRTNEPATCYVNVSGWRKMAFTGSVYHEMRWTDMDDQGVQRTLEAKCLDIVKNEGYDTTTYTIDLTASPRTVTLSTEKEYYVGEEIVFNATVEDANGKGLGELNTNLFSVELENESLANFGVGDIGDGVYLITLPASLSVGNYSVQVGVGSATPGSGNIAVEDLSLNIKYAGATDKARNIVYEPATTEKPYIVGVASDASNVVLLDEAKTVSAGITDGRSYIFVTRKGANLGQRDRMLRDQSFDDYLNPSFGYRIEDLFIVNTEIEYEDIILRGPNKEIPGGRYTLVLRNAGIDPTTGKTIVEVDVI